MIEGILVEGLIYSILALGVFVSFRVLDFPDLTVEGSFPAGAAAGAVVAQAASASPLPLVHALAVPAGLLAGFIAGGLAGFVTAVVHHRLKVPPLLAGIVTMTGLYSINLRILGGKPNLPLITNNPMLAQARSFLSSLLSPEGALLASCALVCLVLFGLLDLFFHTEIGIAMGALGDNENAVIQAGIQPNRLRTWGIMLANALPGLSGAMAAAYQGFADVNLGQGVVAAGLATVMLGELVVHSQFIGVQLARVFLGSIIFRALMYAARSWGYVAGITPNDLRLLTALLIIASVAISRYGRKKR
ncbi:MAG: ABC transporter permease [Rectinema subterraneum]|uniref:ABC transporter permease n=1 Tax=Rectinema subterraneum TaxID=2653714 RepID=UPI003C79D861